MKLRLLVITLLLAYASRASAQSFVPLPQPKLQFFSNTGAPLAGGKVFFYSAGTSTLAPTYIDSTGTAQNTDPVILDTAGRATIFLGPQAYKVILQDSTGAQIWSVDGVTGSNILGTLPTFTAGTITAQNLLVLPNGANCTSAGCTGMVFSSAGTFNGGLTTLNGTNSQIYIGAGGNFYNRPFSGGDANCTGVADGWQALRTDTKQLEFCAGGTTVTVGSSATGPQLGGTNTWTAVNTFTVAANFNGGITTGNSSNSSITIGTGGNFWTRTFSGGEANCTGIADGWIAVRTDVTKLEVCVGGVVKVVAIS